MRIVVTGIVCLVAAGIGYSWISSSHQEAINWPFAYIDESGTEIVLLNSVNRGCYEIDPKYKKDDRGVTLEVLGTYGGSCVTCSALLHADYATPCEIARVELDIAVDPESDLRLLVPEPVAVRERLEVLCSFVDEPYCDTEIAAAG